jgi:hypothetical protein
LRPVSGQGHINSLILGQVQAIALGAGDGVS